MVNRTENINRARYNHCNIKERKLFVVNKIDSRLWFTKESMSDMTELKVCFLIVFKFEKRIKLKITTQISNKE